MSELKGDYECSECGYSIHEPSSKVCSCCGGELCYMMTEHDEVIELRKERDALSAEVERLKAENALQKESISVLQEALNIWKLEMSND